MAQHKPFMLESQRSHQSRPLRQEFLTRKAMQDQIQVLLNSRFTGEIEPWIWNENLGYVVDTESLALLNVQPIPEQQSLCAQLEALFGRLKKSKDMFSEENKVEVQALVNSLYDLEDMDRDDTPTEDEIQEMYDAMDEARSRRPQAEPGDKTFTFVQETQPPYELGRIPEPIEQEYDPRNNFLDGEVDDTLKNIDLNMVGWSGKEEMHHEI